MANPTSLAFTATGTANAQQVGVSQANYAGSFAASGCSGVVTTSVSGGTVTVTPVAAGTCSLTVSGGNGGSANVGVTVTTTIVVSQ